MTNSRPIHPDFQYFLNFKDTPLVELFMDLRNYLIEIYPKSNELLYHTHALTAVFSISEKLQDAFCHIPIYSDHLNLGFNKGVLLSDPRKLLKGTGKFIRHINIKKSNDFRNQAVQELLIEAYNLAKQDMDKPTKVMGQMISKIKN